MDATMHTVTITSEEVAVLDLLELEPELIGNLNNVSCRTEHEARLLERLRRALHGAAGARKAITLA